MNVPSIIQRLYYSQLETYKLLEEKAKERILNLIPKDWHYEGRVKGLESYSLKLECGKCLNPTELDDFFACTIVVQNLKQIEMAESIICDKFKLHERRPINRRATKNESHSFLFDDLRLYVRWQDNPGTKPLGLEGILFEVQIKTYLQHAWGIATHDLTYKTYEKNWAKERIAFQIKAMLEHAETVIYEADVLSTSKTLDRSDIKSKQTTAIIKLIEHFWKIDKLPPNRKLLAETIQNLILELNVDLSSLRQLLNKYFKSNEKYIYSLSPYGIIIHALIMFRKDEMVELLNNKDSMIRILCYPEIEESLIRESIKDLANVISL